MIISLEDYNNPLLHDKSYIKNCINLCVERIGVNDLKYIFEQYIPHIDQNTIVGLYQKDFNIINTENGSYSLLLQKKGNYKLMEHVKLKISDYKCVIGIIISESQTNLDLGNNVFDIYNLTGNNATNILIYRASDVTIFSGVLKTNGSQYCIIKSDGFTVKNVILRSYHQMVNSKTNEEIRDNISNFLKYFPKKNY